MGNKASISSTNTDSLLLRHTIPATSSPLALHAEGLASSYTLRRRPQTLNTNTADAEMRTAIVPETNRLAHAVDFLLLFSPPRKAVQNINYARGVIVSTSARRAVGLGLSLMTRGRVETCASFSVGVQYRNPLWTPIVPNMSA